MPSIIAMFNHKGGVSKTTTAFNIGWMLASQGHRTLLVDMDPQCNLSGLILGYRGEHEFDEYYNKAENSNLRQGLAPAFESQPRALEPVQCIEVPGQEDLFLLPGHIRLSEYEVTLGIAQELTGSIVTLQNLPGSIHHLVKISAENIGAEYVIIDMNPSLSSLNQNALMISDYFIVPNSPDYFSLMALESLRRVLPRWRDWASRAATHPTLQESYYRFPDKSPKYLGNIIQNYRPRLGEPTEGFQSWINRINDYTAQQLVPALAKIDMSLGSDCYEEAGMKSYCLAQIANFNTLIAKAQDHRVPVFAISDEQIGNVGVILEQHRMKRTEFREIFSSIVDRLLMLKNCNEGA